MSFSKHAGWFDTVKRTAKNPYVMAAAMPIIGAGVDMGIGHVRKMMDVKNKARAYKGMLAENPVLRKKPPKTTQKFFNTLYNANPDLAKDPLVASSWVHTQMEQQIPGVPHAGIVEGVSDLIKIRQQTRGPGGSRGPGFFAGRGEDLKRTFLEAHSHKVQDQTKKFHAASEEAKASAEALRAAQARAKQQYEDHKRLLNERIQILQNI